MTSFAFIMGVLPLVFSSGAGAEMRHAMGVAVFSGMLGVTFFGLVLTPVFYVVISKVVERRRGPASPVPTERAGAGDDPCVSDFAIWSAVALALTACGSPGYRASERPGARNASGRRRSIPRRRRRCPGTRRGPVPSRRYEPGAGGRSARALVHRRQGGPGDLLAQPG